nr:glycosyltransferase family 4 protein [uncultured Pedobacter sp.]
MQRKQKGIISNPNLAPYIKESVLAYQEADMLAKFYTTFCISKRWTKSLNLLPKSLSLFLGRRSFLNLNPSLLQSSEWAEIIRVLAMKWGNDQLADQVWEWSEKRFDGQVAKKITAETAFFHGYEHASLSSLRVAKDLGIPTFYEQPSQHHAYFTSIVEDQVQKYSYLKNDAITLLNDEKAERRNRRRDEELELSDYILCNSSFTKRTLLMAGVPPEKLIVIPYGYPAIKPITPKDPQLFHFIYAGNLSLRKGVHLLLKAWTQLPADLPIFLTLMGSSQLPQELLAELPKNVAWMPNLPYELAQEQMAKSHVLVLPTLADGFGMVISESMAMGVPVLTTEASAGPDLIENYTDGLCIPADDVEALKKALLWCATHAKECAVMGRKAQAKAKAYPWSAYREKLIATVKMRIDGKA